jgi:hypothetical protein
MRICPEIFPFSLLPYLSEEPHAEPHPDVLLSEEPQAAVLLSEEPHADAAASSVCVFHPAKFESAISMSSFEIYFVNGAFLLYVSIIITVFSGYYKYVLFCN